MLNDTITPIRLYYGYNDTFVDFQASVLNGTGNSWATTFNSNSTNYLYIGFDVRSTPQKGYDNAVLVYQNGAWTDQAYRTLTFAIPPTGDLLTWLQANGTKQGGGGGQH